jgi:orotidine-5'-phosphate decarboxylase
VNNPIIVALDTADLDEACRWTLAVRPHVGMVKIGLEFHLKYGREGYHALVKYGLPIMLDIKLHDIPNTVAGAVRSVLSLSPAFVTVHAFGGPEMIAAARDAIADYGALRKTKILAVTVLTSLDNEGLRNIGCPNGAAWQVSLLADMAIEAGADGIVCSPHEVEFVRRAHPDALIVVPGIRPAGADANDQSRPSTPQHAMTAGASHLVIGRPITQAPDPGEAARAILESLS